MTRSAECKENNDHSSKSNETFKALGLGHESHPSPHGLFALLFEASLLQHKVVSFLPQLRQARVLRCAQSHLAPDLLFPEWNLTILFLKLVFDCFSKMILNLRAHRNTLALGAAESGFTRVCHMPGLVVSTLKKALKKAL